MAGLLRRYGGVVVTAAFTFLLTLNLHAAPNFSGQTFATGTTLGTTQPDSTCFGLGPAWISYQNGSDSTGLFGSSTVVRYSPTRARDADTGRYGILRNPRPPAEEALK
jgi:hypothetical protein